MYELAPVAVMVADVPALIEKEDAEKVKFGKAFTTTFIVCVPKQPESFFPKTEKTVETDGVTVTKELVKDPGIQVYVLAPLAVKITGLLGQLDVCEAIASVTEGFGVIVKIPALIELASGLTT